jgi:hypothetical protein
MNKINNEKKKLLKIREKLKNLIDYINKKYNNKYLHFSNKELSIESLMDKNNIMNSLLGNIYMNPAGLWFSCGSKWIDWIFKNKLYKTKWANVKYVYEIKIKKKKVIFIKNVDQLLKFHHKNAKYSEKYGYKINWHNVKKKYDGISICPYLGDKIWKEIGVNNIYFEVTNEINQYIQKTIKRHIIKYPEFYLEWYRHWETASGVIWRMESIKSIDLIRKYNE